MLWHTRQVLNENGHLMGEKERKLLRNLPDQPDAVYIRLPKPKNTTRTDTDSSLTDRIDGIQSFIVRPCSNDL